MISRLKSLFSTSEGSSQHTVDLHSHLLPGIDDGVKTIGESLEIIRAYQESGFEKIITTPHIHQDYYANSPDIIRSKLSEVRTEIQDQGLSIEIEAAAEYFMDDWFVDQLNDSNELLTFGDNHILVETSFNIKPLNLLDVIFQVQSKGYKPILAHPERYSYLAEDNELILELKNTGILFQLNINSLGGFYGPSAKKLGEKLIDKKWIELVGSDCHSMRHFQAMMTTIGKSRYWGKVMALPPMNDQFL